VTTIAAMVSTTTPVAIAMVVTVLALMAPMALVPMPPTMNRRRHTGRVEHPRGWWGVNHPGRRAINHWARHPYLRINREMADARVHRHRRFNRQGMGATHLGQTQAQQAEQRDGSGK
jgi:hypothetical protein